MNEENAGRVSNEQLAAMIEDYTILGRTYAVAALTELLALRAADHPAVVVRVKPLQWKDLRGDGSRWAKDPYGGWIVATPNGWGNRDFPEQEKVSGGLTSAMEAADTYHRLLILSCIEPLRPATEQAGGEVGADDFQRGVQFCLGVVDKVEAAAREKGWEDEATGAIDVREAILSALPSPAATQSAVVSDEMVERGAAELANIRGVKIMDEVDQRLFASDARAILIAALSNPGASQ